MKRLLVHVEGQTEEEFVNQVLASHLYGIGYYSVGARIVGNARLRARRGGIRPWPTVKGEIIKHLAGDLNCIATTMVDYYALPHTWPGRASAVQLPYEQRGKHVQAHLLADLEADCSFAERFEPFVLMHEFEALLFSDCNLFAKGVGQPFKAAALQQVRDAFQTPEHINDSPQTAPSKRVAGIIPGYQKPLFGNLAILEIGLPIIRNECPHFGQWLTRLEARVLA